MLDELAVRHGTDKSSEGHWYTRHYSQIFSSIRESTGAVLEIGVGNGSSLKVWRDYFPNAFIYGIDFNPQEHDFVSSRISTFNLNQTDCEGITSAFSDKKLEIIIDDASHEEDKTMASLNCLFPLLQPRGWYVIEDMSWGSFPEVIGRWITEQNVDRYYVLGSGGYGRPNGTCIVFIQKQP